MSFSRAVRQHILNAYLGKETLVPLPGFYIGISLTLPTSIGGNIQAPTDTAYARQYISAAQFSSAILGDPVTSSNTVAISFEIADTDWYQGAPAKYAVYFSALTGGTYLGYGVFAREKPILAGDRLEIAIESLFLGFN